MWKHSTGAFLWDDPDWDQWSEITRNVVDQMNWWIHSGQGFMGSFDLPWSGSYRKERTLYLLTKVSLRIQPHFIPLHHWWSLSRETSPTTGSDERQHYSQANKRFNSNTLTRQQIFGSREIKQLRRRRRQLHIRVDLMIKTTALPVHHDFSTFLWRPLHDCGVKPPIWRFMEGVDVRQRIFLPLFELE